MDLEDVLCQVNSNCNKLRNKRLLDWGQRHQNYAGIRRQKQEPSTPSIEMAFSKLMALLRKHAACSFDAINMALGEIVDLFSVTECRNFFKAAGYEAQ